MAFIPVPSVSQVEQIFDYNGQTVEMVHHYRHDVTPTIAAWESVHAQLLVDWNNTIRPVIAPTLVWVSTKFTDLTTAIAATYTTVTSLPNAGTSASPQLPNNVALVMTKRTANRGRSYRGRSFIPGLTEAVVTGNSVLSTFTTPALAFFVAALNYTGSGIVFDMCVVSRFTENAPRGSGINTLITNFTFDTVVDSQRRRLPLRGN